MMLIAGFITWIAGVLLIDRARMDGFGTCVVLSGLALIAFGLLSLLIRLF